MERGDIWKFNEFRNVRSIQESVLSFPSARLNLIHQTHEDISTVTLISLGEVSKILIAVSRNRDAVQGRKKMKKNEKKKNTIASRQRINDKISSFRG